jgi:hypothetical protein
MKQQAGSGAIYCLGILGALVYFLNHAQGIKEIIVGIIMAFFWPGVFVYKALELLKM